jgi:hypothetical protein
VSDGIEIARLTIVRTLTDDDDEILTTAVDGNGNRLALVESLGLLAFAQFDLTSSIGDNPEAGL